MALRGCIPFPVPSGPEGELLMKLDLPSVPKIRTENSVSDATRSSMPALDRIDLAEELSWTEDEISAEAEYFKNVVDCNFTALKVRLSSDVTFLWLKSLWCKLYGVAAVCFSTLFCWPAVTIGRYVVSEVSSTSDTISIRPCRNTAHRSTSPHLKLHDL